MIISASRRTDIPNYYPEWFFNRINAGFVDVRNPMNAHQISRIDLSPGGSGWHRFLDKESGSHD